MVSFGNPKSPSGGGIDSLAKGQDLSSMAGENPISKSSNTRNDIEEVNTMDWDSEDVTVPTSLDEQTQPTQTNPAKETSVAKSTGEPPASKTPTRNPYAAGSHINRLTPTSVFVTFEVLPQLSESKIDGMLRDTFAAIFATEEEAQILPHDQTSREPPLTQGSDPNNKTLRPIYATIPRFLKRFPDGGKKYEFHVLMKQGNMTFHDVSLGRPSESGFPRLQPAVDSV